MVGTSPTPPTGCVGFVVTFTKAGCSLGLSLTNQQILESNASIINIYLMFINATCYKLLISFIVVNLTFMYKEISPLMYTCVKLNGVTGTKMSYKNLIKNDILHWNLTVLKSSVGCLIVWELNIMNVEVAYPFSIYVPDLM